MEIFTVGFFCDEELNDIYSLKDSAKQQLKQLVSDKEYIEFLVCGKNKTDMEMSKIIYEIKDNITIDKLILVLANWTEYKEAVSCSYYDEIEILRNEGINTLDISEIERCVVARADALVFLSGIDKRKKITLYAEELKKKIIYI